ncbi:MAG: cytochrome c/FTR1 family iron permease [Gemmatimonadota bacterium]|nr:cytochrome c/FTR1 family iron permease [Gemmatimonadota bacterium]
MLRPPRALLTLVTLLSLGAGVAHAQDNQAKRLASIVGVAVEEYAKGIDAQGHLLSEQEYLETVEFLRDARQAADRLPGARAAAVRAALDSLVAAVAAKAPPDRLGELRRRFVTALGSEGALDLPKRPVDLAAGRALYAANCASCHGDRGLGDGPGARGMKPAPPAIGSAEVMKDATPALLYRVMSVGIPGTQMPAWASRLSPQDRWNLVSYLHSMRATQASRLEGEGLFLQRCAGCHGLVGLGEGSASHALTRLPPEVGSLAWQAERSDAQLASVVRNGVPGTAMPPSRELSDAEVAKVVAYLRSLAAKRDAATTASATDTGLVHASRTILTTLDQALAAAQAGRTADAADRAADAYIAFEPLETPARAKNPGLVASMERHFADFKGAVKAGDLRSAQRSRDAVEAGFPTIIELTRRSSGPWATFIESLLIILREGFEAILVIGAVVAFLLKTGHRQRLRSIWVGVGLGVVASAVMAVILQTVLRAMPASREILEGITLLVAVVVLFSVSYWLISKVEAAKWQQFIREKVSMALEQGGGTALAVVAFLAVFREGAETALFFQALFGEGPQVALPLSLGIVVGFAALAVIFTLFYRFGVRIPLRPFFAVTSVMLYYMAFVFAGKGVRELQEGDALPITVMPGLPHVDAMGIFPTVETVSAQLLLVALFIFALARTFWPKRTVALPTLPPDALPATDVATELTALRVRASELEARLAALESESASVASESEREPARRE